MVAAQPWGTKHGIGPAATEARGHENRNSVSARVGADDSGEQLPSGVYFCRVIGPGFKRTKKIALVK